MRGFFLVLWAWGGCTLQLYGHHEAAITCFGVVTLLMAMPERGDS